MYEFQLFETAKNEKFRGNFYLKYYDQLIVEYVIEEEEILFSHKYLDERMKENFETWHFYEKEKYTTFIFNFFYEIKKINMMSSFEGELVEEYCRVSLGDQEYTSIISYQNLSSPIHFLFYPGTRESRLLYEVPISINSEGQYASPIPIHNMLKKETIERMWDPFRKKTKYRLQLLNELR